MSKPTSGDALTRKPMAIRIRARQKAWAIIWERDWPRCCRDESENTTEIPTRKRNEGKMKSASVHPFHSACMMGEYALASLPGLSTTIMAATKRPRKMSRHIKRGDAGWLIMLLGLDEDSPRDAVAMPDTILARVKIERSVRRNFSECRSVHSSENF